MFSHQIEILIQRSKTAIHLFQLHSLLLKTALDHEAYHVSQFIYSACSISITSARLIFDKLPIDPPLFAWNSIIRSYTKTTSSIESIKLFFHMKRIGLEPDNFTYPFVVKACGQCSMLVQGQTVHSLVFKAGFGSDPYIGNTLLKLYTDCNSVRLARKMFDEMSMRDVVSWSSMIAGYVACNYPSDAYRVFQHMRLANEGPNSVTLVNLLCACMRLLDVNAGKSIHAHTIVNNMAIDAALGTALLEMYSKCGQIDQAFQVFSSMIDKNLQSWTVMISGFADHGHGLDALWLFSQMEQNGLKPDSMSFSVILSACSHLGLVEEGQKYFNQMVTRYGIEPKIEHYGCMVDLLGRAGLIEEAYEIIKDMPMEPNSVILRSFLGAYRNHPQIPYLGDDLRKLVHRLETDLGANYVLAANLSSLAGGWNDSADIRVAMKHKGLQKVPGCSWVG